MNFSDETEKNDGEIVIQIVLLMFLARLKWDFKQRDIENEREKKNIREQ